MADELSTVISDLWTNTDSRLGEIFMFIPENTFAGLSGMTVADLLFNYFQSKGNIYFHNLLIRICITNNSDKHLLGFHNTEFPEVTR